MSLFKLQVPNKVFYGTDVLAKLKEILVAEKAQRPLLFTDEGIHRAGLTANVEKVVAELAPDYLLYDQVKMEPNADDVTDALNEIATYQPDFIIAIGGGSVMDTSKLVSVLLDSDYNIHDLLETPARGTKKVKTLMIPTTCGTGAEATINAIVGVPEKGVKIGIVNEDLMPDYVLLDVEMIMHLPAKIVASSGVDALCHSVECFTSNKANYFSNAFALQGAKLIFHSIKTAYLHPEDRAAKEKMLIGSFYGGVAITSSGTTAVHALSYPLGGTFHIPHGVSNAILFAAVMKLNADTIQDELAALCDYVFPETVNQSVAEKVAFMIKAIENIVAVTEIPESLTSFGVTTNDLDFLVHAASEQKRLLNQNKKVLTLADIELVYRTVL